MSEAVILTKPEALEPKEHFDVGIFFDDDSSDDERVAKDLVKIINDLEPTHQSKCAIVAERWYSGDRFDSLEDALNRCTLMFVIISESLLKSNLAKANSRTAFTSSIQSNDGKKFIPIFKSRSERDKLEKMGLPTCFKLMQGHSMEKLRDPESFSSTGLVKLISKEQPKRIERERLDQFKYEIHSKIYSVHREYQQQIELAEGEQALRDLRVNYGHHLNNVAIDAGYTSFRSLSTNYSLSIPELSSLNIDTITTGTDSALQPPGFALQPPASTAGSSMMASLKEPVEDEHVSNDESLHEARVARIPTQAGADAADHLCDSIGPQPLTLTADLRPPRPDNQPPPQRQQLPSSPKDSQQNHMDKAHDGQAIDYSNSREQPETDIPTVVDEAVTMPCLEPSNSLVEDSSAGGDNSAAGTANSYTRHEDMTLRVGDTQQTSALEEDGRLTSFRIGGVLAMDAAQNWSIGHREPDTDSVRAQHDDTSSIGDLTSQYGIGDEIGGESCLGEDFDSGDEAIPDAEPDLREQPGKSIDNVVDLDSLMLARATGVTPLPSMPVPHQPMDVDDGESVGDVSMHVEVASTTADELDDFTIDTPSRLDSLHDTTEQIMDENIDGEPVTDSSQQTPTRSARDGIMHRSLVATDFGEISESSHGRQSQTVESDTVPRSSVYQLPKDPSQTEGLYTGGLNTLSQPMSWPQVAWGRNRRGSESGRRPIRTNLTKQFLSLASVQSLSSRLLKLHHHPSLSNVSEFDEPPRLPEGVRIRFSGIQSIS